MDGNAAFKETVANQIRAASPDLSAFVSANAGSGKTRVLTTRVARLLLAGVPPSRLLCITFTKAAASEMADRLFQMLGEWSLANDEDLAAKLANIGAPLEETEKNRDEALARARRLFATALETPGGLKIQTIHAFCETILKRFPLEAGVAPGFSVIEDADAARLKAEAIAHIFTRPSDDVRASLAALSEHNAPSTVRERLENALANEKRRAALTSSEYTDKLAGILGINVSANPETLIADIDEHIDSSKIEVLASALLYGGKTATKFGNALSTYRQRARPSERLALLEEIFFTTQGTLRTKLADASAKKAAPHAETLEEELKTAMKRFTSELRAARILTHAKALSHLTCLAASHYEKAKAARAGLDFDDLIQKTRNLLESGERAQWVMYKLDQGIEHILLDEAQDTSPDAWRVIEAPLEEFFSGSGAREARATSANATTTSNTDTDKTDTGRTFFAVGDQKQSIYSFQGADAALFQAKAVDLGKSISAVAPFEQVPLNLSFRTSEPVLSFVDALFEDLSVLEGVSIEKPLSHGVFRIDAPGRVELWPLTPKPERIDLKPWDAPLDALSAESPARKLANAVASEIKRLIDSKETLAPGRPVRAGDVMILVQSRGTLFREMIKALSLAGVPAAGADKLKLMDDQATKDLFSFARAVLFENDDLSLAETLKSPFYGYADERLFALAYGRQGTLRHALETQGKADPEVAAICQELQIAGRIALTDGPFAFFTHLLETGTPSGRKRLLHRLGQPACDPLNALLSLALDFEQSHPRSLTKFLKWTEERDAEVNRDAENAGDVVRVMTAHKSKGLEAPVVFLLDAHSKRTFKDVFLPLGAATETPIPIIKPARGAETEITNKALVVAKRLNTEEYRRLLYVAATRARDRLYICGIEQGNTGDPNKTPKPERSWHALAQSAFDFLREKGHALQEFEKWDRTAYRIEKSVPNASKDVPQSSQGVSGATKNQMLPDFFRVAAPKERPVRRLQPSQLAARVEASAIGERAISPISAKDALIRGTCLHRLLEVSTHAVDQEWIVKADALLASLAPDTTEKTRAEWRDEAKAVLNDPVFAAIFGSSAKAEVSIGGRLPNGAQVSGQIDRLVVTPNDVLIVDFKTNRPPPKHVDDTPAAYLAQMGAYAYLLEQIYPKRAIRTAILWTFEARLSPLPPALTTGALSPFLKQP